jgi:hypothetical protein
MFSIGQTSRDVYPCLALGRRPRAQSMSARQSPAKRSKFGRASFSPLTHAVDATPSFYRQEGGEVGNEVGIARESRHRRFFKRATNGQMLRPLSFRGIWLGRPASPSQSPVFELPVGHVRTRAAADPFGYHRLFDHLVDTQEDRLRDGYAERLGAFEINDHLVAADRCEVDRARQALRLRGLLSRPREDVFAAIIRCTADRRRVDKRTRSKWSRVLRYVKMQKDEKEPLTGFIKRKGGINECTIRYGRCLRRLAARRRSIGAFQRRAAFLRG